MQWGKVLFVWIGLSCLGTVGAPANAQLGIIEVIRQGVKRVIKAVDLKIQRLQNKTIWLQNAQKFLETELSKLKLTEIAEWTDRQRQQYQRYYQELSEVKSLITQYQRIREMTSRQVSLVKEYQRVWRLIQHAGLYSPEELEFMANVYSGMLDESLRSIEQIGVIIGSFSLQMSHAARLKLINQAADQLQENYDDLRRFNTENMLLALGREKETKGFNQLKQLYGLDQ